MCAHVTIQIQGCSTRYSLINGIYDKLSIEHHGKPCYEKRETAAEETLCYIFHSGNARWLVSKRIDDGTRCYAFLNDDTDNPGTDVTECRGKWTTCNDEDRWVEDEQIICCAIQESRKDETLERNVSAKDNEKKPHPLNPDTKISSIRLETAIPEAQFSNTIKSSEIQSAGAFKSHSESHHGRKHIQPHLVHSDSSFGLRENRAKRRTCSDWVLGTTMGYAAAFLLSALTLILLGMICWKLLGGTEDYDDSWDQSLWIAWGFFFDPGAHMSIPTTEQGRIRFVAIVFSLLGFIFNLVFLGVVVDAIRRTLDAYRQDRDRLFITDHTVILGWCDKTLFLLDEILAEADSQELSTNSRQVVVMAERDNVEMMQDIRHHFLDDRARIACVRARKGCAYDLDDLLRASIGTARKVIVLASDGLPRDCDLEIVRICVALASLPSGQEILGRVIAEVRCLEVARILKKLLPNADGIHARSSANQVFCLCAAAPLVGYCFLSLCSFAGGEELYVHDLPPHCAGKTFGEVCKSFAEATVIGIQYASKDVELAPRDDRKLCFEDRLILLASDMSQVYKDVRLDKTRSSSVPKSQKVGAVHPAEEKKVGSMISAAPIQSSLKTLNLPLDEKKAYLILGWPNDFVDLVRDLDTFAPPGSVIHVLALKPIHIRNAALDGARFENITVEHYVGDRRNEQHLKMKLPFAEAFSILIVAESMGETRTESGFCLDFGEEDTAGDDAITSDSACLMCLLMVDSLLEEIHDLKRSSTGDLVDEGLGRPHVICEVLDPRTDRLLSRNSDLRGKAIFFRSNMIETGMFMMAATDDGPVVFSVLKSLMSKGSGADLREVPLVKVARALHKPIPGEYSFWELHDLVRFHGGMLVGWVLDGSVPHLCPSSAEKNRKQKWIGNESLLVICQSDGNAPLTLR